MVSFLILHFSERFKADVVDDFIAEATPEQKRRMAEITAVMSLLEGHADHVMDAVGPAHVPSVASIRAAFDKRRTAPQNPAIDGTADTHR